jgi:thiamine-phosphate pyrophosphorylase
MQPIRPSVSNPHTNIQPTMQRYAITDRSLLPRTTQDSLAPLIALITQWAAAGIEWVQIREKDLDPQALAALTTAIAAALAAALPLDPPTDPPTDPPISQSSSPEHAATRLLISGLSPQQALACGAHGVHLPGPISASAGAIAIQQARAVGALVSVSCHTLAEVTTASRAGASLILWAPVFGKQIRSAARVTPHTLPGTGLALLRQACSAAAPTPVFALGGVTLANAPACVQAGAVGIAGIRLFHPSECPET